MSEAEPPIPAPIQASLRTSAVRGAFATSISQAVKLVVQFASVVILARMLDTRAFGVYAMVVPIISLATLFQDFGLASAVITRKQVTQAETTGVFWLNLALSLALAILVLLGAPALALFYGEPAVAPVAMALAAQIVLAGLSAVHLALISRRLQFGRLAAIEVFSVLSGLGAALLVAASYDGPWALIAQALGTTTALLVGAWIASGWAPDLRAKFADVAPLLRFGAGMTSFSLTSYVARNADNVLIGRANGPLQLGLYDRAYKLLLFPIMQINQPAGKVLVPLLSRLVDEPDRYRQAYTRTLRLMLLITFPGVAVMILTADRLIPLLLGDKWAPVVPIFAWLGLVGLFQVVTNTFGWLFISQRRTKELALLGLFNAVTSVGAFVIGLRWGAVGVAAAYGLSGALVRLPLNAWALGRHGPVNYRTISAVCAPYILSSIVAAAIFLAARTYLPEGRLLYILAGGALFGATFSAVLLCFAAGRTTFIELLNLIPQRARDVFRRSKAIVG